MEDKSGRGTWMRNHVGGIMTEESWRRNHGRGTMEKEHTKGIMEGGPWQRSNGGGTMQEDSHGSDQSSRATPRSYLQAGARSHGLLKELYTLSVPSPFKSN